MLSLIVLNGPNRGQAYHLTGEKPEVLGRQAPRLKLLDGRVSRQHAEVYTNKHRWFLRDIGSSNGTHVNGERITEEVELHEGDQVRIGRIQLVVGFTSDTDARPTEPVAAGATLADEDDSGSPLDADVVDLFEPESDVPALADDDAERSDAPLPQPGRGVTRAQAEAAESALLHDSMGLDEPAAKPAAEPESSAVADDAVGAIEISDDQDIDISDIIAQDSSPTPEPSEPSEPVVIEDEHKPPAPQELDEDEPEDMQSHFGGEPSAAHDGHDADAGDDDAPPPVVSLLRDIDEDTGAPPVETSAVAEPPAVESPDEEDRGATDALRSMVQASQPAAPPKPEPFDLPIDALQDSTLGQAAPPPPPAATPPVASTPPTAPPQVRAPQPPPIPPQTHAPAPPPTQPTPTPPPQQQPRGIPVDDAIAFDDRVARSRIFGPGFAAPPPTPAAPQDPYAESGVTESKQDLYYNPPTAESPPAPVEQTPPTAETPEEQPQELVEPTPAEPAEAFILDESAVLGDDESPAPSDEAFAAVLDDQPPALMDDEPPALMDEEPSAVADTEEETPPAQPEKRTPEAPLGIVSAFTTPSMDTGSVLDMVSPGAKLSPKLDAASPEAPPEAPPQSTTPSTPSTDDAHDSDAFAPAMDRDAPAFEPVDADREQVAPIFPHSDEADDAATDEPEMDLLAAGPPRELEDELTPSDAGASPQPEPDTWQLPGEEVAEDEQPAVEDDEVFAFTDASQEDADDALTIAGDKDASDMPWDIDDEQAAGEREALLDDEAEPEPADAEPLGFAQAEVTSEPEQDWSFRPKPIYADELEAEEKARAAMGLGAAVTSTGLTSQASALGLEEAEGDDAGRAGGGSGGGPTGRKRIRGVKLEIAFLTLVAIVIAGWYFTLGPAARPEIKALVNDQLSSVLGFDLVNTQPGTALAAIASPDTEAPPTPTPAPELAAIDTEPEPEITEPEPTRTIAADEPEPEPESIAVVEEPEVDQPVESAVVIEPEPVVTEEVLTDEPVIDEPIEPEPTETVVLTEPEPQIEEPIEEPIAQEPEPADEFAIIEPEPEPIVDELIDEPVVEEPAEPEPTETFVLTEPEPQIDEPIAEEPVEQPADTFVMDEAEPEPQIEEPIAEEPQPEPDQSFATTEPEPVAEAPADEPAAESSGPGAGGLALVGGAAAAAPKGEQPTPSRRLVITDPPRRGARSAPSTTPRTEPRPTTTTPQPEEESQAAEPTPVAEAPWSPEDEPDTPPLDTAPTTTAEQTPETGDAFNESPEMQWTMARGGGATSGESQPADTTAAQTEPDRITTFREPPQVLEDRSDAVPPTDAGEPWNLIAEHDPPTAQTPEEPAADNPFFDNPATPIVPDDGTPEPGGDGLSEGQLASLTQPTFTVPDTVSQPGSRPAAVLPVLEPVLPVAPSTDGGVAFIVDASGSLVDTFPQVIEWVERAMGELPQDQKFTVIFFCKGTAVEVPPPGLRENTPKRRGEVVRWLRAGSVEPHGRSDPIPALYQALDYGVREVYLLSDNTLGRKSAGPTRRDVAGEIVAALARKVGMSPDDPELPERLRVHTVQFFYDDPDQVLEKIANHLGGSYQFIHSRPVEGVRAKFSPLEELSAVETAP